MIVLNVVSPDGRGKKIDDTIFRHLLLKAAKDKHFPFPKNDAVLNLVFVDDKAIKKLNVKYRKRNIPTDVLSFLLFDEKEKTHDPLFGEIYISLERAQVQASERNHSFQTELNKLFVHGLLHLLGFDHENEKDFFEMESYENQILKMPA